MITRVWHGWTTPANAPKFEALLEEEIFVGIARREIPGYHGISLLKRTVRPAGTLGYWMCPGTLF